MQPVSLVLNSNIPKFLLFIHKVNRQFLESLEEVLVLFEDGEILGLWDGELVFEFRVEELLLLHSVGDAHLLDLELGDGLEEIGIVVVYLRLRLLSLL